MQFIASMLSKTAKWRQKRKKYEYRLTSHYRGRKPIVVEFSATEDNAHGKTVKAFAYHMANLAILEKRVGNAWIEDLRWPDRTVSSERVWAAI